MSQIIKEAIDAGRDSKGKKWEDYDTILCPDGEIIDMQKLLEEQQATMQQQHQEEEKREKEQEKMLRRAEHRAQSGQNRLNLVVGILTVFQVAGVIYAFFSDTGCWQLIATFITFVIGFFLLYIVMSWDNDKRLLIKWARNIYYRGKVDQ